MKNSCTNGRHYASLPRCTGPHLQPSTPALLKSIPLASSGPHSFHIGARFQHETKLSCLWEESKITTRVSVLKAAGCYRAVTKSDPCRCEQPWLFAPRVKASTIAERIFFFFTKLRTRRDVHERYISLNCLLSVWFQSADSQVRRLSEQLCQKVEEVQKLQEDRGHLVELSQVSATHKDIHHGIQHGNSTHWGVKVLKIFIQNKKKHLFLPVFYFIKTNWSTSSACFTLLATDLLLSPSIR